VFSLRRYWDVTIACKNLEKSLSLTAAGVQFRVFITRTNTDTGTLKRRIIRLGEIVFRFQFYSLLSRRHWKFSGIEIITLLRDRLSPCV
jgi:hypothetical protein